ncbi:uncharacterized protein LOC116262437 isoform X2 [Nymphaea colorata]|uniref:uncharacterized protein LOC116262437 isoform X2 n=1 Tax=Nymphaea colorata TaxID=210225 RepID=UPI00214EE4C6|nr:uncharacterized protein LOC116262437 isoform X2 [Nymphaea colorata]
MIDWLFRFPDNEGKRTTSLNKEGRDAGRATREQWRQEWRRPRESGIASFSGTSSPSISELEFIHKSCGTIGYRDNVLSTTLPHLIATGCGHLIMPFVAIRERLKEKVEEFFGCEYELFIEFTGLISWTTGSRIGWHSDDNRPYLKQRHFAAVCYLNTCNKDFMGGIFHFQEGEPNNILPTAGITNGERLTLTLWFTRDSSHDEDTKILDLLSQRYLSCHDDVPDPRLPVPASSNMYWFSFVPESSKKLGFDIRWARVYILGYNFYFNDRNSSIKLGSSDEVLELLNMPLLLIKDGYILERQFSNSLQALQVVQFCLWRGPHLQGSGLQCSESGIEVKSGASVECCPVIVSDQEVAERIFVQLSSPDEDPEFSFASFGNGIAAWENYVHTLHTQLLDSLPLWLAYGTISPLTLQES